MKFFPGNTDFIDIHSHRSYPEPGVFRIYNDFLDNRQEVDYNGPKSTGIHPWHISGATDPVVVEKNLTEALKFENVLFVGETGLDRYRQTDIGLQTEIFRIHLDVAEKIKKPVILHCVRAFDELFRIREEVRPFQSWIFHGFNSSPEMARTACSMGIHISIGERLAKNRKKLEAILENVPLSAIFMETDDGDLSIAGLYELVAEILQIELAELKNYMLGNYKKIMTHE